MARLGWVPGITMENNTSGRFESRWSHVKIVDDNFFFKGMKDLVLEYILPTEKEKLY